MNVYYYTYNDLYSGRIGPISTISTVLGVVKFRKVTFLKIHHSLW